MSLTPISATDFEGVEFISRLAANFKYGSHNTTVQKWYKRGTLIIIGNFIANFCLAVFSMKDGMVYDVIPNLYDFENLHVDKLFSNASQLTRQIIHPQVIQRDQPFEIVAVIPPGCEGTNHSVVFYKDASLWCDKMQNYPEIFTVLLGGFVRRCTIGKEFWDNCPLDTEKVGISLRYTDSWGGTGYLVSAEISIGRPGTENFQFILCG